MANYIARSIAAGLVGGTALLGAAVGGNIARLSAVAAAPAATRTCGAGLLPWFAPEGNGYAGGAGYVVEFSNIGGSTCAIRGYPRVALTENGKQVGLASTNDSLAPVRTVVLGPGQTAHVVLLITDAGAVCRPLPTNGLAVQPPGTSTVTRFPLVAFGACRGKSTLRIDAVNPGVGIPYMTSR